MAKLVEEKPELNEEANQKKLLDELNDDEIQVGSNVASVHVVFSTHQPVNRFCQVCCDAQKLL